MVTFNSADNTYHITLHGGRDEYCGTLRALARMMASLDEQSLDNDMVHCVSTLLEEMMPTAGQLAEK